MNNSAITVRGVSKVIQGKTILQDIDFTLEAGTLTSLIGPNGAGKSTLVKLLLGLDTGYQGSVITSANERIQYIAQQTNADHYQLPLSVQEYFSIATTRLHSKRKMSPQYTEALEHVGMSADVLKQSVDSLSGGEKQRVAIARALLLEPTILILDEPLAAVDYASRQGLYELIRHLQQDHNMTVLLVSHDVESVIPLSDQILCLDKTLHTQCSPAEFDTQKHEHPQGITHRC